MEEVRQLVAEEGREARNLVAFHVAVDSPARISRKPPRLVAGGACAAPALRRADSAHAPPARLRSASAGRDKRAELQARYWALLFGNLQRAIGEIYTTVESHENLSECQEVILVLENYTRDFKSLCEWFRLKWEYDNTPPPQRPQSLAWEVRKTDFVRPESRRTHSVKSSPSVSGKNSPCLSGNNTPSGKNSPSLSTGKASPGSISGKISPRVLGTSITSPKANVEFFGSKGPGAAKIHSKIESKSLKDTTSRLSDIKEKVAMDAGKTSIENDETSEKLAKTESPIKSDLFVVEMGTAKEYPSSISPKLVVIKTSPKKMKIPKIQDIEKSHPHETLEAVISERTLETSHEIRDQTINNENEISGDVKPILSLVVPGTVDKIVAEKTDELQFVITDKLTDSKVQTDAKNIIEMVSAKTEKSEVISSEKDKIKISEEITEIIDAKDKENNLNAANITEHKSEEIIEKCSDKIEDQQCRVKSDAVLTDNVSNNREESPKTIEEKKVENKPPVNDSKVMNTKPAYSQAAAKPKTVSSKPEIKSVAPKAITSLTRSKTVVEIKPNFKAGNKQVQAKRTANNRCSYPFNLTTGRSSLFDGTPMSNARTNPRNYINRTNTKVASGDRAVKNEDTSKRVPPKRPSNLKTEGTPATIHKVNPNLDKLKDSDNNSSTDTIVTQIDRNESNESLKTLVPDPEYQLYDDLFANSIEVLNVDDRAENDNDGWLTVKSRRLSRESKKQSKSHWANRFNQPSATASLPTLNMMESPKQEHKSIVCKSEEKETPPTVQTVKVGVEIEKVQLEKVKGEKDEQGKVDVRTENVGTVDSTDNIKNEEEKVESQNVQQNVTETHKDTLAIETQANCNNKKEILESKDNVKIARKMPKVNILEIKKPENRSLKVISTAIIRQKSDVTGLKSRSSRNKSIGKINRNDKQKDKIKAVECKNELTRNRLHSSLESLIPSGLSRSQESTEDAFDFDKWKFEFKNSIDFLEDEDRLLKRSEYLKTADPVEMSEIALMTCEIEENERKISLALDFQCDVDQRKLCEEEDLLNRQIKELQQSSDIEFDTETDDTETDAEILCEDSQHMDPDGCTVEALGPLAASLEDQYEPVLAGLSWAERVDTLATLEALVARYPGRAQQLHAKLSQGIRRRGSLQETLKRYQWKQARAEHQRLELQTERTNKIHQLLARVEDVKAAKNQLIEEKRQRMEQRLQKAAENRDQHLKDIVRKAHDEEEKLREIAFIKQLEAEHRRQDFLEQCRSHTARLRQMRRDRLRKLEQKAAREAAVGARRQALEEARAQHVFRLVELRRQRDARVVELKERTRQRRDSAARQKAADVKSRLVALAAAADADAAALRSRIRHKQDATRERHAEHLQAIRTRALQPIRQHTTSESHEAKPDEEQVLEMEAPEVSKEKLKAIRKKARKLKHKLFAVGQSYENNNKVPVISPLMMKNKMCRAISQLQSILAPAVASNLHNPDVNQNGNAEPDRHEANQEGDGTEKKKKKRNSRRKHSEQSVEEDRGAGSAEVKSSRGSKGNSVCSSMSDLSRLSRNEVNVGAVLNANQLDRSLNELFRIMEKVDQVQNAPEKVLFRQVNGTRPLCQILALAASRDSSAPSDETHILTKSIVTCVNTLMLGLYNGAPTPCLLAGADLLNSNGAVHAAQLLLHTAEATEDGKASPLTRCLADLLSALFDSVKLKLRKAYEQEAAPSLDALCEIRQRALQIISYLSVSGVCARDCGQDLYRLLTVATQLCTPLDADPPFGGDRCAAWQSLRAALRPRLGGAREQFAALSVRPALPPAHECGRLVSLLRVIADRDHTLLQESLGEGGGALEFSAAAARLLAAYAPPLDKEMPRHSKSQQSRDEQAAARQAEALVLDLIVLIGFFVVNSPVHQEAICGGGSGGVVRLLCGLPAGWLYSDQHSRVLLPTLAALAADQRAAERISADLSLQMIEEFVRSPDAKCIRLVQLIQEGQSKQKLIKK